MVAKVDLKRALDRYRAPVGSFRLLDLPVQRYLMIDGHGDPNVTSAPGAPGPAAYPEALAALYPVAYALKFASRLVTGRDYVVPPLEGLWWADDLSLFTTARDKSRWDWTMMILVPDWVDASLADAAIAQVGAKRTGRPERLDDLRLEALDEGRCVQTLHVGSYDDEAAILARMHHEFIPAHGLEMTGKHHEIYLSDPRRTAPEKLRTLLRQPVRPGC
ncbi:GyrI-like domain-containing protein [Nocardioides daejeonensis]|uniref:GyrI-like domain-containing protein n=1 Tax=Nocardioides daejeonensis TaxID=1046556 RepID=UPI000D74790D|nr:GyrI-like domain-containing protein [Nocardioides daejeonensis]